MHPSLVDPTIAVRVDQDGLCGFTGASTPPPSADALAESLPALAEWGVTMGSLVRSPPPSAAEQTLLQRAGAEVDGYVRRRWREDEWETAWFVNPPVSGWLHIPVAAVWLTLGIRAIEAAERARAGARSRFRAAEGTRRGRRLAFGTSRLLDTAGDKRQLVPVHRCAIIAKAPVTPFCVCGTAHRRLTLVRAISVGACYYAVCR